MHDKRFKMVSANHFAAEASFIRELGRLQAWSDVLCLTNSLNWPSPFSDSRCKWYRVLEGLYPNCNVYNSYHKQTNFIAKTSNSLPSPVKPVFHP